MPGRIRERAEVFAIRIVLVHILAHLFRDTPGMAKRFSEEVERSVDSFEFHNGWTESDIVRLREYMRLSADHVIGPAARSARRR